MSDQPVAPGGPSSSPSSGPISAWQRWEMAAVSQQAAEAEAAPPAAAPVLEPLVPALLLDAAELARLQQQAQQCGEREGHQQGLARGHAEGYAAGMALAREQAQSLQALLLTLPAALRAAEREIADDVLNLALDIARQMVGQALVVEPQLLLTLVRELLGTEPALSGTPRLLLHADDAALVQQHLADDLQTAGWRIRTDLSITRGGCKVHAASGALDATLETRWERVSAALGRRATPPREAPHD